MRLRIGAVATVVIVLVEIVHAPVVPVMIGATVAYALLLWRAAPTRRSSL
jgi:hypothetical protein